MREVYISGAKKVLRLGGAIRHRSWREDASIALDDNCNLITEDGKLCPESIEQFFKGYISNASFLVFREPED